MKNYEYYAEKARNQLLEEGELKIVEEIIDFFENDENENKELDTYLEKVLVGAEHPGILEVPAGKNVNQLGIGHFIKLAKKKSRGAVVRALMNLHRWNKKQNPKLSKWAKDMQEKVSAKLEEEKK